MQQQKTSPTFHKKMPSYVDSHEIEVPVSKLKIGMYVSRLDKQWLKTSFKFQGFFIENEEQILKLQRECVFVYVDELKEFELFNDGANRKTGRRKRSGFSLKVWLIDSLKSYFSFFSPAKYEQSTVNGSLNKSTVAQRLKTNPPIKREITHSLHEITLRQISTRDIIAPTKSTSLDKEIKSAKQSHDTVKSLMREFSLQIQAGDTLDLLMAEHAIYDCMTTILRNPDAMQLVTRLKSKHQTSWQRGMNNAVLAISFGRYLNLAEDDLITLGLSGLLHDIGYLAISKKDFEEAENKREIIRSHAKIGYDILSKSTGRLAGVVAEVAYSHHERLDGSGFPRRLIGSQISSYSRMIAIVDTYNMLTHPVRAEKRLTHYDAIAQMLERDNTFYDEVLLNAFYLCIGTYPVGCVVQMNSGEIAMVVEINERHKLRPKIVILTDAEQKKCNTKMVDLSETEVKKDKNAYIISRIISHPEKYGLTL